MVLNALVLLIGGAFVLWSIKELWDIFRPRKGEERTKTEDDEAWLWWWEQWQHNHHKHEDDD